MKVKISHVFQFCFGLYIVLLSHLISEPLYLVVLYALYFSLIVILNRNVSILDPRLIVFSFILIYSIWFPLQAIFIGYDFLHIDSNALSETVRVQLFASFVFVSVANAVILNKSRSCADSFYSYHYAGRAGLEEKVITVIVLLLVAFELYSIFGSGLSTKRELADNRSLASIAAQLSFTFLYAVLVLKMIRGKGADTTFLAILLSSFLFFVVAGERDVFFKAVLIICIVYVDRNNLNSFFFFSLILFSAILIVPVSQAFKAVLLSEGVELKAVGWDLILSNEFTSAGRNLYSLVYFGVENSFSYLLNDLFRAMIPSVFFSGEVSRSTASWYNLVYRYDKGFSGSSGWGFSLIGQGFLVYGYLGVAVVMGLYSYILSSIYNARFRSEYFYAFFVLSFLVSIYVLRADFANFLSQTFKISGLAVLFLYLIKIFFRKSRLAK